jgi:hypothetical protein
VEKYANKVIWKLLQKKILFDAFWCFSTYEDIELSNWTSLFVLA